METNELSQDSFRPALRKRLCFGARSDTDASPTLMACGRAAVVALAAAIAPLAQAIVPIPAATPAMRLVTVNNSPGQQNDPHVSGDLVVYIDQSLDAQIRYYNFATGVDAAIPRVLGDGTMAIDLLPDVSGSRVVFTRLAGGYSRTMVFDTATSTLSEVDPVAAPQRLGSAIGGNTVGLHRCLHYRRCRDMGPRDIEAEGAEQFRGVRDKPECVARRQGYCLGVLRFEHLELRRLPGGAYRRQLGRLSCREFARPEGNPDTNGRFVVYEADRSGSKTGQDIFVRGVAGSPERQIEIPGTSTQPEHCRQLHRLRVASARHFRRRDAMSTTSPEIACT